MAILVLDVAKEVYQTLLAITATQADLMAPFTKQELWQVSSMRGDCAPRPDGFTPLFLLTGQCR
jgi:hypothetical protein